MRFNAKKIMEPIPETIVRQTKFRFLKRDNRTRGSLSGIKYSVVVNILSISEFVYVGW